MPTLTIVFKNVGLIVNPEPSRALMLRKHHQTTIVTPRGKTRRLTGGQRVTIRLGGQAMTGKSKASGNDRLVRLKDALTQTPQPKLRPEVEIKARINAEVIVPKGTWNERDPQFKVAVYEIYKKEKWKFDSGSPKPHKQTLTNIVEHNSKLDKNETYSVYIGEDLLEEFDGAQNQTIEIRNDDVYPANYPAYSGELDDFQDIFSLLAPLEKPFPKVKQTSGKIPPGSGWTRPICPMAQIG